MKRSLSILLTIASVAVLTSSCESWNEYMQGGQLVTSQELATLDTAKTLLDKKRYDDAIKTATPLLDNKETYSDAFKIIREAKNQRFVEEMNEEKKASMDVASNEVRLRDVLPESYGKTVVIDGSKPNEPMPPGPMEKVIDQKVSMNLQQADLDAVVMALSRLKGINIVADNALSSDQQLTVKVQDVPLKELLNYIARNMGVAFHLGGNVVWVTAAADDQPTGPKMLTRIYRLRSGVIPSIDDGAGEVAIGGAFEEGSSTNTNELEDALVSFLSDSEDGAFFRIYKNRNLLMVRNTAEKLRTVDELVKEFDSPIKQVIIEARFLTVSKEDVDELGFNVPEISLNHAGAFDTVKTIEHDLLPKFPDTNNLELTGVIGRVDYKATLHAVYEKTSTITLDSPRITVLNNRVAKIRRGDVLRYYEEYELETVPNEAGVAVSQPVPVGDVQEEELGVTLEVKPMISHDGKRVMLHLRPEIKSFLEWETFINAKLPKTNEHTVETTIVVESGETVVMGGLMNNSQQEDQFRIPIIKEIPIVGDWFGHSNKSDKPLHLLIFVTATIVQPTGEYAKVKEVAPQQQQ